MPDEKPPSPVPSGLLAELYRDLRRGAIALFHTAAAPLQQQLAQNKALTDFHPDFITHERDVTQLVDYAGWHEGSDDWREGNGLLVSSTFGELPSIWARPERYMFFESGLVRFIRAGGEVRRTFIIGREMVDAGSRLSLYRTLRRHHALKFQPRVRTVHDLNRATKTIDVACDMVASFNGRISYFLRAQADNDPTMVRTVHKDFTSNVENFVKTFWEDATPAESFMNKYPIDLPPSLVAAMEEDLQNIHAMAHTPDQT
jgi:hypothetical protein